ncbi:putative FmdB family regulatory protein [Brevibacterium sanguinis]|uniref:FmdB family regulatory protein n=2 Tax=Brevibacterium TaxID=1696 RepID=A0ABX9GKV5_9MICO|nr:MULTISPECIES: zinc ribbon domain-containing protein [Brevibacterium]RBP62230.1 putative FmdB family regulatory protein [Brevibacterium sanguinis]RBP70638.1 putative FmdB family regulatory protein [Brevibacterium celere]
MPTYTYRCRTCGTIEQSFPITDKPSTIPCPSCRAPATTVFSSPHLGAGASTAHRLIDATKRTAETPGVVSQVPGSRRAPRPVSRDPRHAKLPRA